MRKITLLLVAFLWAQFTYSQDNYKRVNIPNSSTQLVKQLDQLGVDLTCGVVFNDNGIQMEVNQYTLDNLDQQGIGYTILIEDMQKFYSERASKDLPKARAELQYEKSMASQRSYSVNEILNNVGQYNECDEIDWAVPVNWNLNPNSAPNSFGGCLTYDMVLQELDDMRTYSIANGLNIISQRLDASLTPSDPGADTTFEGRTIYYIRISDNPDTDEAGEPETLYQSLIHSREAATVMNQLFFMWYILENYNTDPAIQNLVNNQALYFIPVFNPDGFVYNQTAAPNGGGGQRKNRNTSASGTCTGTYDEGIDLNRNSEYFWNNGGSSNASCNTTYMGTAPFSENETQIMRDFFLDHDFELALNHHSFKNAMLHAYAGVDRIPGTSTPFPNPRADEYSKYNHDMTEYNRYAYGPSTYISSLNSGNMNDWMLGGANYSYTTNQAPIVTRNSGTGSGKSTLAWTPENGLSSEGTGGGFGGFWPQPSNYLPIAKRAMRMNFLAAYFSGKYAKVHDLNQNDITTTSGNLSFAIENLGQQASDFTLTVTPISGLATVGPAVAESFSAAQVLEQRTVNISYTLDAGIQPEDKIEFKVVLTNNYATDNVLYEADIEKAYTPNVIFAENPDPTSLVNWTSTGSWTTTTDAYSGTRAIKSNTTAIYGANQNITLQLNGSLDLTNIETALIQFYGKWDLERSFDFVTIEGSLNGTSGWTPLCGKLTKAGAPTANNSYSGTSGGIDTTPKDAANTQNGITALYDGDTQDKWNMEEIVIDASNNSFLQGQSTVFLRFRLDTDANNRKDSYANADFEGFSFDDFKIIEVKIPCDNSLPPTGIAVSNLTPTSATVDWNDIPSANYDLRYRIIGSPTWTEVTDIPNNTYNITGLTAPNDYEVQVRTRCTTTTSAYSTSVNFSIVVCTGDVINSYPYSEDFDSGIGNWTQDTTDDTINPGTTNADWALNSGTTPSAGTGPSRDFTAQNTANATIGSYFYIESSTPPGTDRVGNNVTVNLISPCYDLTNYLNANFSFYYHRYGNPMGDLRLDVSADDAVSWTTINTLTGQQQASNVEDWIQQTVDLSAYDGQVIKLRFSGTTPATGFVSDMAIDQISLTADENTLSTPDFDLSDVLVVPNPFNDSFSIKFSQDLSGHIITLEVFDLSGRSITNFSKENLSGEFTINELSDLASGSYFVKITDSNYGKTVIKQLIKD